MCKGFNECEGLFGDEVRYFLLGLIQANKWGTELFVVKSIVSENQSVDPGAAVNGGPPGLYCICLECGII